MAEGLLTHLLRPEHGWAVSSAGVYASRGARVSSNSVAALREKNIDISSSTSTPLTPKLIAEADLLITMTQGHLDAVLHMSPQSYDKVFLLKSFGVSKCAPDIYDPVGESLAVYRHVRDEIDAALPDLILAMMDKRTT